MRRSRRRAKVSTGAGAGEEAPERHGQPGPRPPMPTAEEKRATWAAVLAGDAALLDRFIREGKATRENCVNRKGWTIAHEAVDNGHGHLLEICARATCCVMVSLDRTR